MSRETDKSLAGSPFTLFLSVVMIIAILGGLFALTLFMIRYISQIRGLNRAIQGADLGIETTLRNHVKDPVAAYAITKAVQSTIDNKLHEATVKYQTLVEAKDKEVNHISTQYRKTLQEKKQTENVMRSISDGLIVLNSSGEVLMMNPAAERLLDMPKEQQIGKSIKGAIKKEQLLSLAQKKQSSDFKEIELDSENDETKKVIRASSAVIEDENGQTIGMVSMLTDITKQKELDRLKDKFVSTVSHELRTPLIAVRNAVAIMLNKAAGPVTELQDKFLTIAQRNLERLGLLINDLLDISKLEAGRMEINRQACSVDTLLTETCETMAAWAKTKEISIVKHITGSVPNITVDAHRVTQILTNLIGNAVKFTPQGGTITVGAERVQGEPAVLLSVKDNGIGIPKEDLQKIFDKFYQSNTEWQATHAVNGTGLGLAICKEIVELHGGKIWAESERGQGATFFFTLPL
ncbi:MAG: ATP-binding protein [Candidatus Omnitrophica bacterium]|nr:ATP-binding protein [Candidatus Omnitrophota bacterium]